MKVVGLDLSLRATGACWSDQSAITIRCPGEGPVRLACIRDQAARLCDGAELVVLEGYSFGSPGQSLISAGEIQGLIRVALYEAGIPWAAVPPGTLKRYATGRGNAPKPDLRMELYKRAGLDLGDDNQVDAWWLRAMGLDRLGAPVVELPAAQRDALEKVDWPTVPAVS